MKKAFTKILSVILAVAVLFGIGAVGIGTFKAKAAEDVFLSGKEGMFYYLVKNGKATVDGIDETMLTPVIDIPDTLGGYPVTAIESLYHLTDTVIEEIIIPETVEEFEYLTDTKRITVDSNNKFFSTDEHGVLFDKDKTKLFWDTLKARFDFVIADAPAGMGDGFMFAAGYADEAIIVTLHQSTSVRAAEKTAARLSAMGVKRLSLVVNGYRAAFAENGRLPDIIDIINRSSVRLLGVVPYGEKLQASQEAAELAFMGDMKKKASKWEAAFYNIASRLQGERIKLFSGSESPKKRSTYKGIVLGKGKPREE